jgi:type IV pilus assembly protein PilB
MIEIPVELKQLLTQDEMRDYGVIPTAERSGTLHFATSNIEEAKKVKNELTFLLNRKVVFEEIPIPTFKQALATAFRNTTQKEPSVLNTQADLLEQILHNAQEIGSSDIHIEIYDERARVRYRIDGKLQEQFIVTKEEYPSMVNKIKIRSNLDISEKRLPQDGRIKTGSELGNIEMRVSVLPTLHGEKIVLRLLQNSTDHPGIDHIGFDSSQLVHVKKAIQKPNGIILISGPTGSGKTTTLYGLLKHLNTSYRNITTVEDPIEYTLEGINQIQVNEAIGMTFSGALRSILRQDPDIIMLGEIRDKETADLAIRASLTGHLVLSTIHTNSAWGVVNRLIDMGIPGYLLEGTLNLVGAQRLVRKLCKSCTTVCKGEELEKYLSGFPGSDIVAKSVSLPVGCKDCYHTGYSGRIALFEVIGINDTIRSAVRKNIHSIDDLLEEYEINTLKNAALHAVLTHQTSLEEAYPILIS